VICIGSELLSGKPNTHIDYFTRRLRTIGLPVSRCTTVSDSLPSLTEAFASALQRADVIISAGGLGPTFDDLTREAVCAATDRGQHFEKKLFDGIRAKFRYARVPMPEENRRQAFVINGADVLDNPHGSAPGQHLKLGGRSVYLMPGPFSEMSPMFESFVLPALRKQHGGKLSHETLSLHFAGLSESAVDEALQPVIKKASAALDFTILGGHGLTHFYATATAPSRAAARRLVAGVRRAMPNSLRSHLYSEGDPTLEAAVGSALRLEGRTLAVAESCTGGLLAARITDIAGSSDYFLGGMVAYSNDLKTFVLGVSPDTLKKHGAVSAPTALEMAEGARRRFRSDYALSVTGIAGPGGGTPKKPVGLVYIGLAGPDGESKVLEIMAHGDRHRIRSQSANAALDLLRKTLQK